jgi:hypothetical protein
VSFSFVICFFAFISFFFVFAAFDSLWFPFSHVPGVEEKFLGNLVQELTLKVERRGAMKLLCAYYRFQTASYREGLLGALRSQTSAFASLLSEVAAIARENDPILLLYESKPCCVHFRFFSIFVSFFYFFFLVF